MAHIVFNRAAMIACAHVPAGAVLAVGSEVTADDAATLVRHGIADTFDGDADDAAAANDAVAAEAAAEQAAKIAEAAALAEADAADVKGTETLVVMTSDTVAAVVDTKAKK